MGALCRKPAQTLPNFANVHHFPIRKAGCEKNIFAREFGKIFFCNPPQKSDDIKVDKKWHFCNTKIKRYEEIKTFGQRKS